MKITQCLQITFLLLLALNVGYGQKNSRAYRPDCSIKYNPLAFLAHTPGIELGVERTIGTDATVHLGASYLDDFGIFPDKNFSGYKLIGEYRLYNLLSKKDINNFVALQFNYKKAIANGRTFIERNNGSYQELIDFRAVNTSLDFMAAIGRVQPLNPWLSFDLSIVAGVKRLSLSSDDVPDDALINIFDEGWFDFTIDQIGSEWYPVFRMQFKLNFELN